MASSIVCLVRHGETEWTLNGRHTSVTDLPLTSNGERVARLLAPALAQGTFALVLTSPLQRARRTCELAGLGAQARIEPDLVEWNYGEYEGLTPQEIARLAPGWMIFNDGCPGGEKPEEVAARVDRVIARARAADGDVVLFAHGHVFRVFAARWLGLPPSSGAHFILDTATLSVLSHYGPVPAVKQWNVPPRLESMSTPYAAASVAKAQHVEKRR
jgi:probable phosphoglycerate mutase